MKLSPDDKLTRYIRKNSHCKGGRILPDVFIPPNNRIDVSVFVISNLLEDQIWNIAFNCLTTSTVARADIFVESVYINKLKVIPDKPPSKHANITPFPQLPDPTCLSNDVNLTAKKDRRALASKLAHTSKFIPSPTKN